MKIFNIFICIIIATSSIYAQQKTDNFKGKSTPDFDNWTEAQIQQWEDSVINVLYPEPTIGISTIQNKDTPELKSATKASTLTLINRHVPNSYTIDKTKAVGEIPMSSTVTPTGSVAYNIPISVAPGIDSFQPQISVNYNSMASNGVMGIGWGIGGLPSITRSGKSMYYDERASGVLLNNDDAFIIDGLRLIKLSSTSTQIEYESVQGKIKVKAFLTGNIIKYFEVSYPDGNKGTFGYTSNVTNRLSYPLTSFTDLKGNTITYSYTLTNNNYYITSITYNGASVNFLYATSRPDPIVTYEGGIKVTDNRLLRKIECKSDGITLRTYDFTYQTSTLQNISTLTKIDLAASGKSLNPLIFYYGEGNTSTSFKKSETQLYEWYSNAQPGQLIVSKGKFDYGTDNDGLISLPNKNPYWRHFRNKTWFRKQHNYYDNKYDGTEKIFLYAGLNDSWASPMPNLTTEAGFIDIFAADVDGKYEEEIIKVNNTVSGNYDKLQFKVYSVNLYTGLSTKSTVAFNFPTVLVDEGNNKSVHPKFHFAGDFNGDGKMEVLSISNNHPFGWNDRPSRCYLFDLDKGVKLYEGNPFSLYKDFLGTEQTNPEAVEQNSDRLFVFDYDGDGKTDICLINDTGTYIYTFEVTGSTYSVKLIAGNTTLKKSTLDGRQLLLGEFNGDGKLDIMLSPKVGASDWYIYYAMGNGQFEKKALSISYRASSDKFLTQDVNSDGLTDLMIIYDSSGFYTYLTKPGENFNADTYTSIVNSGSVLIPTNINSRNYFHQLVSLKDGKVTRFTFSRNDTKEKLLTGSVNSMGVVNKNYYKLLNEEGYHYAKGSGATFPFENFQGPISVPITTESYVGGQLKEQMDYRYENAVIHKQGLGFSGFGKVNTSDNMRDHHFKQEFDPYKFGILTSDESPTAKTTNIWLVDPQSNKIAKIRLMGASTLDKLTNLTVSAAYVYDNYENVTKETVNYGGGITIVSDQTYYNSTSASLYLLGQPITKTVTNTRSGSSWIDKEVIAYNTDRLPVSRITYTGTTGANKTGETQWTYNANGRVTSEKSVPYNVTEFLGNTYTYDSSGRYIETVTNAMGQTTKFSNYDKYGNAKTVKDHKDRTTTHNFDEWGSLTSTQYPDGTTEAVSIAWGGQGLYTATQTATGQPTSVVHYDALGRELRTGNQRFDGQWQYVDNAYDNRGRLEKTSLPFKGSSPTHWNSYTYDSYNRPTKLTEASGKSSTWSYSGMSVTETKNGIATTKTTDASGALISVTDPGGTISYALRPDGQPTSITAPGGVVTSFGYDAYGRQTSINDPSGGTQTFSETYSTAGVRTNTVKDANNKTVTTISDKFGRATNANRPEFNTTYTYNTDGLLTNETSNNGTSALFTYDSYDRPETARENTPDGKYLLKKIVYGNGNISSVQYTSQNGSIGTENFVYANGHNTEIKINGTTTIWKLTEENALGQPTKATTGSINRTYSYTAYGMPTGRTAGNLQNFTYNFDVQKGNLLSRTDNGRSKTETFGYDNLNRLSTIGTQQIGYAANGNITSMPSVGTLAYENSAKPYQVTMLTPTGTAVPLREQNVSYTSYQRPNTISENGITASFAYNSAGDRVKMDVKQGTTALLTRYYIGGQYELDTQTNTERLYLGGDAYSAPAIYVKEGTTSGKVYYICRDYLGSITHIANSDGSLKAEYSYDAWGRLRNPATQEAYATGSEPTLFLGRGYTGHEHLPWFGLINMNARLYDPLLGRFLSPDPYIQAPNFTQNFNRYSYCLNNPLVYVDENGEWFFSLFLGPLGAVIDAALWSATIDAAVQVGKMMIGKQDGFNWAQLGGAFIGGAVGGAMGAIAPAFTQSNLLIRYSTKALYAGAVGIASAGAGMLGTDLLDNGKIDISGKDYLKGMMIGGGISMGISLGVSAYDYATWDKFTDIEKITILNKEYGNKFQLDNSIDNYAEYRFNRSMTKGESRVRVHSKALATKSMAFSIAEHELTHMADFANQSMLVKAKIPTKNIPQFIEFTEQNATYHQLANASKHNITGKFWQHTKAYGQSYGLTNSPNTFSIRQILKNIW